METESSGYRLLDHTADAGVRAWGPDPQHAFAQATRGMFAIIFGGDPPEWPENLALETLEIAVEGADWPSLLVNWLAEFVFHFDVVGFVLLVPLQINFKWCEVSFGF